MFLHHDNASSHTAKLTRAYLESTEIDVLDTPPYSPDLAPCDFWLFPKVKDSLRGKRYDDEDAAFAAFEERVMALTPDDWKGCFKGWFGRMQLCIDCKGEYFEKQ